MDYQFGFEPALKHNVILSENNPENEYLKICFLNGISTSQVSGVMRFCDSHLYKSKIMDVKYMIRRFEENDAQELANIIARTLREINIKDYSKEYIENDVMKLNEEALIQRSKWTHSYIFVKDKTIVGCGSIGPYWGSETESSLFTIFVLPEYQGQGIGRKIIETLEEDEYFLIAKRVEIPASITACNFYRKFGYDYKNGINTIDAEELYRLEKYR